MAAGSDRDDATTTPADDAPIAAADTVTNGEGWDGEDEAPRRAWLKPVLLGTLGAAVLFGGYEYYHYRTTGRYMQSTNDAYVSADEVTIASKLAGYVKAVPIVENAPVNAGTLLAEIDPTDYRNRIDQAQAQIELARAQAVANRANAGEAEAGVAQAEAAVATAQRELTYLEREVARYRPLVATGAETRATLDQLVSNRDKAAADLNARRAAVAAARQRVGSALAQGGASDAQIRAGEVQRRSATDDLDRTRLTSPLAGRVGSLTVRTGQFVQPGTRLMTIVPTGDLFVEANFKETQIGLVRPGQPATVKVDALPDVEFHGVVESITPGTGANFSLVPPQNATGNFTKIVQRVPIRIRIKAGPQSRAVLVPGLSLEVTVDTRDAKGAIEAIRKEQDNHR
ncbi:MAG: HlyD family secretion protein [Proteobacteria bacterium]|nr:HlyD family secretion protein [Pseudomonadota bacterium]